MKDEFWKEVEQAYFEVVALPPEDRKAYLQRLYGNRPDVVREVESLLIHKNAPDRITLDMVSQAVHEAFEDEEFNTLIGTLVAGRYLITSYLGSGGFADVYLAHNMAVQAPYALKTPKREFRNNPDYRRRFEEEARKAAILRHENIVRIYDVLSEGDDIFAVMDHVDGETLDERIRKLNRPFTRQEFLRIARQCASALAAAHKQRIVHLDVKPGNIMLAEGDQVKICDFGIARRLAQPVSTDSTQTIDRWQLAGTPAYMAPEVIFSNNFDERADLFSLGTVFYEMLSGSNPFNADTADATYNRIIHDTPRPLPELNPEVSSDLDQIVRKLLAKDPAQRFAGAEELLAGLDAIGEPLADSAAEDERAMPVSGISRLAKAGIVLTTGVLAAVFVWLYLGNDFIRDRIGADSAAGFRERDWILIADIDDQGGDPVFGETVREALTITLQQSSYANVFPSARIVETLQRMKLPDTTRIDEAVGKEICQRENLRVILLGSVRRIGPVYQITMRAESPLSGQLLFAETEHFQTNEQVFERIDTLARRVRERLGESIDRIEKSSLPLARVTTSSVAALQQYTLARVRRLKDDRNASLAALQSAIALDPDFAMAHGALAGLYRTLGHADKQREHLEHAYRLREGLSIRERYLIEGSYHTFVTGDQRKAVESFSALVSLYPDDGEAHQWLSNGYYYMGNIHGAIDEQRELIRLNPNYAAGYSDMILYWARLANLEEALRVRDSAVRINVSSPGFHLGLGLARLTNGDSEGARREFEQMLATGGNAKLARLNLSGIDIFEGKIEFATKSIAEDLRADELEGIDIYRFARAGLLAFLHALWGSPAGARQYANVLTETTDPLTFRAINLRIAGLTYLKLGDISAASRMLELLRAIKEGSPAPITEMCFFVLRGHIALAEKNYSLAEDSFKAAEATYPFYLSSQGLAQTYALQRNWRGAVEEWRRVIERRGEIVQEGFPAELPLAHLELARALENMGDFRSATRHYSTFLDMWKVSDQRRLYEGIAEHKQLLDKNIN